VWYCCLVLCGTVWYCVVLLFGTVWYCVVLCGTVWYCFFVGFLCLYLFLRVLDLPLSRESAHVFDLFPVPLNTQTLISHHFHNTLSHTLSHTLFHTHSFTHTLSHTLFHTHSSLLHTLFHTHTHTHTLFPLSCQGCCTTVGCCPRFKFCPRAGTSITATQRYGKCVFIIHVGCTRCVTSSTDNNIKIHARIALTVECIRTCIFIFLFYV
jgi:hypothetical protein